MAYSKAWLDETTWNEWATCPHCGDREDDSEELGASLDKDGQQQTRKCAACGEEYRMVQSVVWFWKTEPLKLEGVPDDDNEADEG